MFAFYCSCKQNLQELNENLKLTSKPMSTVTLNMSPLDHTHTTAIFPVIRYHYHECKNNK